MAIKQRKQLTGTTAQINAYAGVEGQLVWDKTKKKWVGMSGTAGTNYPMASESHTHSISNVTNLQTTLDGKQPKGDYATTKALTDGLAGKANKAHTHAVADVTNLQTTLNTINNKIPTKTSQLSNDSGFLVTPPTISVAAKTLDSGSAATVTKSGTDAAPVFTFGIPKGDKGDRGDTGPRGPQGPAGSSGPTPNAYVTTVANKGTMWYRKWSDGFIEQGDTAQGRGTRSFGWPFTSIPCVACVGVIDPVFVNSISTTSFEPHGYNQDDYRDTLTRGWYACGY
jgi:hypothetical protein|nr:MAG TPA: tail repeat-like protein [Caudoviricetes sp.]